MADETSDKQGDALRDAHPELGAVAEAATDPVYVVGGAVRDLLLGRPRADVDLVVVGDAAALGRALGGELTEHERFATARVVRDEHVIDLATARTESYPAPGSLPVVAPAEEIEADLARRDFTVNAMAVPLGGGDLVDPFGGREDLDAAILRVLHPRSFVDDPTRAIRAARYAARLGFELEPETAAGLREADLTTVSDDRRETELLRLAGEATAPDAYRLLAGWGLIELRESGTELARRVAELLERPLWGERVERSRAVHLAALGEPGGERELAGAHPSRPSEAVALAAPHAPVELALARAEGAEWLDEYLERWSEVRLEIDGEDLIEAGVGEGPAVGRGLAAARRRKLDGEVSGRDEELQAALEAVEGDALGQ